MQDQLLNDGPLSCRWDAYQHRESWEDNQPSLTSPGGQDNRHRVKSSELLAIYRPISISSRGDGKIQWSRDVVDLCNYEKLMHPASNPLDKQAVYQRCGSAQIRSKRLRRNSVAIKYILPFTFTNIQTLLCSRL
jgi:hypothetical protein